MSCIHLDSFRCHMIALPTCACEGESEMCSSELASDWRLRGRGRCSRYSCHNDTMTFALCEHFQLIARWISWRAKPSMEVRAARKCFFLKKIKRWATRKIPVIPSVIVTAVEPGKSSNAIIVYWFISVTLCPFTNANDFSLSGMVKHLQATRMTFTNLNKTKMFYLYVSLQTSLHSLKDASDSAPSLCQKSNPVCLSSSLHQRCRLVHGRLCNGGPRHRLRLFVCVFLLARLSGLSDKTVKWSVPENQPCTIWWGKKKTVIYNQLYKFLGVGGTKDLLILDSV